MWSRYAPDLLAFVLAVAICAPVLGRGTVIAYDMAWAPRPRWTPFVLGIGIPAPRAVPSDAVAVLAGRVLGAGVAQALILIAILTLAGGGAARLLGLLPGGVGLAGRLGAAVVAVWNPFVAERLAIGHWTVLLGYAVLGPAVAAALRARRARPAPLPRSTQATPRPAGRPWPVLAWLALASAGGANSLVLVAPVVLVVLAWPARGGRFGSALAVTAGVAACWALPALASGVAGADEGAGAFGPRSDNPYGLLVSLLTGGGFWNAASHEAARGPAPLTLALTLLAVAALAFGAVRLTRGPLRPLVAVAAVAFLLVLASGTPGVRDVWSSVVGAVPGGGLLRDSQKLLAPWVLLLALAVGLAVDRIQRSRLLAAARPVPATAALLLPVALQPLLAWGLAGRLGTVQVPADYQASTAALSAQPPGLVGLLPWTQYRRYPWNDAQVALTLAPRMVDQQLLVNDALPTRAGTIAGEDPRAAAVTRDIAAGLDPIDALRRQRVRYVLIEADSVPPDPGTTGAVEFDGRGPAVPDSLRDARLVAAGPNAAAYDLGPAPGGGPRPAGPALVLGWAVTLATWVTVAGGALRSRVRRARAAR